MFILINKSINATFGSTVQCFRRQKFAIGTIRLHYSFKKVLEKRKYKIEKKKSRYYIEVPIYDFHLPDKRKSCKVMFKKLIFAQRWKRDIENMQRKSLYSIWRIKYAIDNELVYIVDLPLPPNEDAKPATPKQSKKFWRDITKILSDEKIA